MGDSARVLVVDDELNMCKIMEAALQARGYEVTICTESAKAMDRLQAKPYGCVLMDLQMKDIEGTELLPIIKHRFPDLPVVIVSAFIDQSNKSYYTSLGAFEVVAKPFSDNLLIDVVSRALGMTDTIPLTLSSLSLSEARDRVFRKLIITALRRANWNQVKAAQHLGISRHSLIRWLRRLKITY